MTLAVYILHDVTVMSRSNNVRYIIHQASVHVQGGSGGGSKQQYIVGYELQL